MYQFYLTDTGYTDAEFRKNGVLTDPDQDATFYVEVYDTEDVLHGTYTLSTTPAITKISDGKFKVEGFGLATFALGNAYSKWFAKYTGASIQPYPWIDKWGHIVESPAGYTLCTVDECKTVLKIKASDTGHDDFLGRLTFRATSVIESFCHRRLKTRDLMEYYTGDETTSLVLNQRPVTAVTVIQDASDGERFDYGAGDEGDSWVIDEEAGILHLLESSYPKWPPKAVKVTYTAGLTVIPEDLVQVAIELVVRGFKMTEEQRQGVDSTTVSGETIRYREEDLTPYQKGILGQYKAHRIG